MGEWIAYGKSWVRFQQDGLNKPGTLVDDGTSIELIGSINEEGGTCECCTSVSYANVIKYKVVLNINLDDYHE